MSVAENATGRTVTRHSTVCMSKLVVIWKTAYSFDLSRFEQVEIVCVCMCERLHLGDTSVTLYACVRRDQLTRRG